MTTKKRGFASMDPAKQREIASKGGKAAHQKGTAHEFTPEEAREAGRKGGQAAHGRGTAHKFTSEEAREAGRKGGRSARGNAASRTPTGTTADVGSAGSAPTSTPENAPELTTRPPMPSVGSSAPPPILTPGPSA
jgi:general stress protein YciG